MVFTVRRMCYLAEESGTYGASGVLWGYLCVYGGL